MKTNITMTQHVTEFVTAEQIAETGIVIQEDLLMSIMLLGYRQNTKTLLLQ